MHAVSWQPSILYQHLVLMGTVDDGGGWRMYCNGERDQGLCSILSTRSTEEILLTNNLKDFTVPCIYWNVTRIMGLEFKEFQLKCKSSLTKQFLSGILSKKGIFGKMSVCNDTFSLHFV